MVFKAYTKKLPIILLHFLLYVTYIFSPAAFDILSLICIFSVLTTYTGNFIFGLVYLVFCVPLIFVRVCISLALQKLFFL